MSKRKRAPNWIGNFIYIISVPAIIIIIIWILFSVLNGRKVNNDKEEKHIEIEYSGENTLDISDDNNDLKLLISNELDKFINEEDVEFVNNEENDSVKNTDENNSINYSDFTLEEIVNEKEEEEDTSFLAQDLAIKYDESKYKGITKDGAFVLTVDGEDKYIYPIGVNINDVQAVADLMYGVEDVYIEYDVSKKKGAGEQAYLWLVPPDNDKKESMINSMILLNGWGDYLDPMPNIKYQYYFLKIK